MIIINDDRLINLKNFNVIIILFATIFGAMLIVFSYFSYLLFHNTASFFIMILGILSGAIGIISYQNKTKNIYSRLSSSIIIYSLLLFVHNLSYEGIETISFLDTNVSNQFWASANFILALGVLISIFDIKNRVSKYLYIFLPIIIGIFLASSIAFGQFPELYNEISGYSSIRTSLISLNVIILLVSLIGLVIQDFKSIRKANRSFIFIVLFWILSQILFIFQTELEILTTLAIILNYTAFIIFLDRTIVLNFMLPYNKIHFISIEERNRLSATQSIAHVGTWELDIKTKKIWASDEAFNIYGLTITKDHLVNLEDIQKIVIPEDRQGMDTALESLITKRIPYDMIFTILNHKGEYHHLNSVATLEVDELDNPIKVNGVIHDITDLRNEQIKLKHASTHDFLTGIFNRRFYGEQIKRLDWPKYLPLSIIMIDINGLKVINDSFGHTSGDNVLIKVASVIKESLSIRNSFAARIGGDEFVVVLPNTDNKECHIQIEQLTNVINNEKVDNITLSVALGMATKNHEDEDIERVIKLAEDEMYQFKLAESSSVRNKIIDALLTTLYEKDSISEEHSKRVSILAKELAEAAGLSQAKVQEIALTGMVHDIGKIAISNDILNKKTKLTNREYNIIMTHPEKGYKILHSLGGMDVIANHVLQHHERIDGIGYPNRLIGNQISTEAKIISIADAYDAMTSYRLYKNSFTKREAINELKNCKGSQFDSKLVDIFVRDVLKKK
ncbi:HD domain-containing phosphohydrolase [Candidatus Izemoplasma sp. B36]|uniref:HD domain-containing phosphohydrolase n=1 Tax=Candidatus Izemoplasma sp. B36 TaxID=3242468 RepID=UPI0035578040